MGQDEITRSLILAFILLIILIAGIIIFVFEYRRRIILNEKEKIIMNEQHAQELLAAQLEIQQETMQYIGREIHDNIGQKLTLASLYAQQIDHENKYPAINERITEVSKIINESLNELRSLSRSLTSDSIAQTDLITLVKNECEKINTTGICNVKFITDITNISVSYQVKNIVLRIIQEFIQNSLKHADCSLLEIDMQQADEGIIIYAADNGKGFLETELNKKGIGLTNIRKRAEAIGGSVHLESKPDMGTNLRLLIPNSKINI
jgi:signal transduction histidine kinase